MSTQTELVTIIATRRATRGSGSCTKIRKAGKLPAVLVDKGQATSLTIDPKLLGKAWQAGKTFNMDLEGKVSKVVITELQLDHVRRVPLHIDLAFAK
jgi:ribosomal protein L25 (general stress protein Ctc)